MATEVSEIAQKTEFNANSSWLQKKNSVWWLFILLSFAGILFLFRGALWNESILAPLDVGAAMYPQWKWLDPSASSVPKNHYLIDIFDFELPRQYAVYNGIKSGEIPWWLPEIDGGRPLLAESYTSATDPFRLFINSFCSFETGYNWIRAVHSFLLGFGAFLLLRYLKFKPINSLFGALSFQFAASHTLFFYPDHLQATFLYYPFLWIIWDSWIKKPSALKFIGSVFVCFSIFFAGNQQSAAYLPIFALCFAIGYGWNSWVNWKRLLIIMAASGILGALLAAPLLVPEMELFLLSNRQVVPFNMKSILAGPLSLSFIFPWVLGTFKTLDLSKLADQMGLGFTLYPGTIAALLAIYGVIQVFQKSTWTPALRSAVILVVFYLVFICCTPLVKWLYVRASDLALLGLVILATFGLEQLLEISAHKGSRVFFRRSLILLTAVVAAMHVVAFFVYPKISAKVEHLVLEKDKHNVHMETAPELRRAQIQNLPQEITFQNYELLAAWVGGAILLFLLPKVKHNWAIAFLTVANIVPLLLFGARFIPREPMEKWHTVLKGGPDIQKARELLGKNLRMDEKGYGRRFNLLPGNTAIYYHIHTLVGYTGLPLYPNGNADVSREANYLYQNAARSGKGGKFVPVHPGTNVRFVWKSDISRPVEILRETCNTITLSIAAGAAGDLIRTDTYYPGWNLVQPTTCTFRRDESGFNVIHIPAEATEVTLAYCPRGENLAISASMLALATTFLLGILVPSRLSLEKCRAPK